MICSTRIAALLLVTAFGGTTALAAQKPLPRPPAQARPAAAAVRVTPGELVIDPPTLINLGFEWLMEGDDNRNASVDVSYRKVGETAWKKGMPLAASARRARRRSPTCSTSSLPNMFAGSILDLEPDTAYEARFVLTDPGRRRRSCARTRRRR